MSKPTLVRFRWDSERGQYRCSEPEDQSGIYANVNRMNEAINKAKNIWEVIALLADPLGSETGKHIETLLCKEIHKQDAVVEVIDPFKKFQASGRDICNLKKHNQMFDYVPGRVYENGLWLQKAAYPEQWIAFVRGSHMIGILEEAERFLYNQTR